MFKFGLGQRVNVPSYSGVQGIVQHRIDSLLDPTKYGLSWLTGMQVNSLFFTEDELLRANTEPEPETEVITVKHPLSLTAARKYKAPPRRKR